VINFAIGHAFGSAAPLHAIVNVKLIVAKTGLGKWLHIQQSVTVNFDGAVLPNALHVASDGMRISVFFPQETLLATWRAPTCERMDAFHVHAQSLDSIRFSHACVDSRLGTSLML